LATGLPTGERKRITLSARAFSILRRRTSSSSHSDVEHDDRLRAGGLAGRDSESFNTNEYLGKVDHSFGNNNRLSVSYYTTGGDNTIRAGTSGKVCPGRFSNLIGGSTTRTLANVDHSAQQK